MYLCTYTFSALWKRRKDMVKKTILVSRYTYVYVLVSVLCSTYLCMDPYRNNTLSSILWTTTFACAKLICQIKKCQTYFHTSTYIAVRTEGTHDKSSWMRKISFFLFSAESLSQTRTIEYWAVECWRTSQTKWCCHVKATSAALRPISTYTNKISIFTAKIVLKFGQV